MFSLALAAYFYRNVKVCKNVKSFPNHKAHRAALISVSLALSQTPVYTARPWILVHHVECLFMAELSLVLIVPIQRGMARLS